MSETPTPQQILDLPLPANNADAKTVRGYLAALAGALWDGASSKRPFGDSDWHHELYRVLADQGWIEAKYSDDDGERWLESVDYAAADKLIRSAIQALAEHECVPTQDAYDRACAALWKHRGRADALAAVVAEVASVAEHVGHDALPAGPARSALLGLATRLRDALRVDEAALKELPHPGITLTINGRVDTQLADAVQRLINRRVDASGYRHAGGIDPPGTKCGATAPDGDEPPIQRASGGIVPSGQTVTIGPAELPPLPKRVKGTHGPTPEATR